MKSTEVRERFLRYFEEKGHRRVPSSSLIPAEDPTLLFTNAGMNQFKDVFTGREKREYTRATSAQKCVRAGGKHNDLDNVGYTGRHRTIFEMLGNFSFGDSFKPGASRSPGAVTDREKGYGLDPERMWATVFTDDDDACLWTGTCRSRILRFRREGELRAMGETGRAGPAPEAPYRGAAAGNATASRRPGDAPRDLEPRQPCSSSERHGRDDAAAKPSVDTGAGLERICAILRA
jgi:alanyl-tRNA synthetase